MDAAHASISVPSTEKWSVDRSFFTVGCASTADRNFAAMSPSSSRSRFFENTEWSHAASSTPIPTNQRNRRSYSSRSIKRRSERIECKRPFDRTFKCVGEWAIV